MSRREHTSKAGEEFELVLYNVNRLMLLSIPSSSNKGKKEAAVDEGKQSTLIDIPYAIMVSREQKRAALREKLQALRSITNSHEIDETAIVVDASKYIRELKQKVEILSQDISVAESSSQPPRLPEVTVETLEKGFLIHVLSDKSCPGLLVSILESFEELGLNVLDARVSHTDSFQLHAFGGANEDEGDAIDSQVIESVVVQAVQNWSESNEK